MDTNTFKVSRTVKRLIFDCDIRNNGNIDIHLYDGSNVPPSDVRRIASTLMQAADMAEGRHDNDPYSYDRAFYTPVNPGYQPVGTRDIICTSTHKDDGSITTVNPDPALKQQLDAISKYAENHCHGESHE
ncbi:hypothetical protein [Bifidobacterium moukalabense]|uniref:hypothetical protein n=1 Tax=Bifidobacterium moukalabense TaxID=1333651 RepID=UPI00201E364A|nr:hypothetical protein [Bifidobacterium moukalabense]